MPLLFPIQPLFRSVLRSLFTIRSIQEEHPKKAKEIAQLIARVIKGIGIFPVFFPVNGNFGQRRACGDWHHRQTVCSSENDSLVHRESAFFWAFSRFPKIQTF